MRKIFPNECRGVSEKLQTSHFDNTLSSTDCYSGRDQLKGTRGRAQLLCKRKTLGSRQSYSMILSADATTLLSILHLWWRIFPYCDGTICSCRSNASIWRFRMLTNTLNLIATNKRFSRGRVQDYWILNLLSFQQVVIRLYQFTKNFNDVAGLCLDL